jgi:hypothetical protein
VILQVFSRQKREGKKRKIRHFRIFGFQWVAKTIEGWLKIYTWFLVDSQIWLNLPGEDRHFCYILLCMVATLAFFKILKMTWGHAPCALISNSRVSYDVSARTCLLYALTTVQDWSMIRKCVQWSFEGGFLGKTRK